MRRLVPFVHHRSRKRSLFAAFLPLIALAIAFGASAPAAARRGPQVSYDASSSAPTFLRTHDSARRGTPIEVARAHLRSNAHAYGVDMSALKVLDVMRDRRGAVVRYQQSHRGVPVWGAQYLVHMARTDAGLDTRVVNGHVFSELSTPIEPAVDAIGALELLRMRLRGMTVERIYPHGLTVLPFGEGVLTHHFTVRGSLFGVPQLREVFVNARTGALAFTFNNLPSDGPVQTTGRTSHGDTVSLGAYQRGSLYELRDQSKQMFAPHGGEIRTHDAEGEPRYLANEGNLVESLSDVFSGEDTRSGAVDAHFGASETYDFFLNLGRDSIDGQGQSIVSTVNATEANRVPMYNAFWDGINEQMVYGNPDPSQFHPFSAALDVAAHELTHGVTQHSGNLAYIGQSGAMNEAYSDYFGNAVEVEAKGTSMSDPEAGYVGEDLCKTNRTDAFSCPLRDLNDGLGTDSYIYFLADIDFGGVHLNSTIFGGALWDVREALGADADRYIYRALEAYVTPLDQFIDGRNAIIAAAQELGANPPDIESIEAAFDAHGITEGWDTPSSTDSTVLMNNVAPISDLSVAWPHLSGNRFVIGDYADKTKMCCVGLQVFAGTIDQSEPVQMVSQRAADSTHTDEMPDISGDRVVWSRIDIKGARATNAAIVTRTLSGNERTIASGKGMMQYPSIDGRLVAWEVVKRNSSDIHARYLGKRRRVVTDTRGYQLLPDVNGKWVSWLDIQKAKIGLFNMRTGKRKYVAPRDLFAFQGPPTLTDRYLFWFEVDPLDTHGYIMRMDLRTGRKKVLVRNTDEDAPVWALSVTFPPFVSANDRYYTYSSELDYLLEFDQRPGGPTKEQVGRDIFIGSIAGGDTQNVTANRADQAYPLMADGRRVIWLDSSSGVTDLVTREVP